jgi:hypothetical protein
MSRVRRSAELAPTLDQLALENFRFNGRYLVGAALRKMTDDRQFVVDCAVRTTFVLVYTPNLAF